MLLNLVPLKPQIVVGLFRKEICSPTILVVSLKKGIESAIIKIFIVRVTIADEEGGSIGKKESREDTTEEKRISISRWHKKNHLSLAPIIFL